MVLGNLEPIACLLFLELLVVSCCCAMKDSKALNFCVRCGTSQTRPLLLKAANPAGFMLGDDCPPPGHV